VSQDRLDVLYEDLRAFVRERDWEQFHDPKNLVMLLGSEVGELIAEYRWVLNEAADAYTHDPDAKARVESEAADVAISLLLFLDRLGVDVVDIVRRKLQVNRENYPEHLVRGSSERPERPPR
jgi:NTP pyrophosphatase (non-canonical NTP hydrolase)